MFPQWHHEIQGCQLPDRHSSSTFHHALLQQGKCFWEQAGDWIPAESSPSKIAIFKLNHFPNHTLKLLSFLASSLQLIGTQASMDLEDAAFSGAAPIPFCRFLHPSIYPCIRLSIPPPALRSSATEYRGHISNLNRDLQRALPLSSKFLSREMAGDRTA